jgi:pimeloyl-ACP methyl ester carboxylesterase
MIVRIGETCRGRGANATQPYLIRHFKVRHHRHTTRDRNHMRRTLVRTMSILTASLLVIVLVALGYRAWRQYEHAQALAINSAHGIQEARFVKLGGIEQWIQIRGEDRSNPVLLILAGGPGNSLVPLTPVFQSWEKYFTVVQWDQRGAGKTFGRNGRDEGAMTIDRMLGDGIELSEYLLAHLRKPTLILVGHSWGTMLGVLMVKSRPELFAAYVGTGQVVAKEAKEEILYAATMQKAKAAGDHDSVARLEAIGAPPYKSQQDLLVQRAVSERYDTDAERDLETTLTPVVVFAPDFSLHDIYSMTEGAKFAGSAMYQQTLSFDARALGTKFSMPFFIFNGDKDLVTPTDLAMRYFDSVDAPQKAFVVLEGGGHSAMLTMSDVFLNELVARVRPLASVGVSDR